MLTCGFAWRGDFGSVREVVGADAAVDINFGGLELSSFLNIIRRYLVGTRMVQGIHVYRAGWEELGNCERKR